LFITLNGVSEIMFIATLVVWSRIGHTPVTNRGGAYCDELARVEVSVASPEHALCMLAALFSETPHADRAYFNVPNWPNQNTRDGWHNYFSLSDV
jgi:hypothetical protein